MQVRRHVVFRANASVTAGKCSSELRQWPVQIKLAPLVAPYFNQADMLVAADCSAFSHMVISMQSLSVVILP